MNKIHRTVWNEARQCFVVASETAKAKGKASSSSLAVAPVVAAALLALGTNAVLAADICTGGGLTTISTARATTDNCVLNAGESVDVSSGGSIVPSGANAIFVSSATIGGITNAGLVNPGAPFKGIYLSAATVSGGVTNSGSISGAYLSRSNIANAITNNLGTISGNDGIYFYRTSFVGMTNNSGLIRGTGTNKYGIRVEVNATSTADINNLGSASAIIGTLDGLQLNGQNGAAPVGISGKILNEGTVSGAKRAGIRLESKALVGNGITNSGTITAIASSTVAGQGAAGGATGIGVVGSSSVGGGLVNNQRITATATVDNVPANGIWVSAATVSGGITNNSGGTITGTFSASSNLFAYGIGAKGASVTGGIVNNGTIYGNNRGISIDSSVLDGGITNSGLISSWGYAIGLVNVASLTNGGISNLANARIVGIQSAHAIYVASGISPVAVSNAGTIIGKVAGPLNLVNNGLWALQKGTTNGSIIAGSYHDTGSIAGNFTQEAGATFQIGASSTSLYSKLTLSGTATVPAAMNIAVDFSNTTSCAGLTAGGTLAGVIGAGTLSVTGGATLSGTVTHNCATPITISARNNGSNAIDLVASAPAITWVVTGANGGNGTVSCVSPVNDSATATCTGTASGGYYLASAVGSSSVCGTVSVSSSTITAGPVTAACTVTGTFALTAVNGTCSGANGTTVTSAPAASCSTGTPSAVSTGNTAYSWTCGGIGAGTPASCSATRNYVVSSSAGANGSISASQNVAYNAAPSFTVAANSGYTIQSVTGCSGTLSGGNYTTAAITASCAVSASFVANVAPTFIGATTTLTVVQSAAATDVKGLLHASDADASQTLTWTQTGTAPAHGTLSITSSTAASGSADVTPGGTITYAPTAGYVGSDSFTVQVSDGTATATRSITVTVSAPTVTVGALTLNSMTVGTAFVSQSFAGAGGYGAYTYSVSAGTLPAGLSLNASTGALSGTPTTAGAYSFTIRAVDSSTGTGAPFAGTQAFSGTVAAANTAPTFVGATTALTVAQGASATDVKGLLHASDADASQTLTWTQNAAPTHGTLAITSATAASGSADVTPGGTITYTPTAGYVGSDSFTVQVSDGTATATRSITVTVGSALTVTVGALTLNSMTVGTAYTSQTFSATGGNAPYTYTVSAGTLPAGLSLNASTGALSGTPTTAGAYSFTIRAVDSSTGTGAPFAGTQAFSGTVAAAAVTATQTNIATLTNGVTAALAATGCSGVNSAVFITAPAGAPSNTTFPFGLLDFRLTGCSGSSVSVTVTYSQNLPANAVFYKELNGTYATYPTTAIGPNSVTFTLTDGGAGDADGLVDGNIHDPSGVGVSAAPASIPTLSEWGLILLTSLMAMFGIKQTRRRKGAQA